MADNTAGGKADSPIIIDLEATVAVKRDPQDTTPPPDQPNADEQAKQKKKPQPQTAYYGTLLDATSVTKEKLMKIPHLIDFIFHRKKDGETFFSARFKTGVGLHRAQFLKMMVDHDINIDPSTVGLPCGGLQPQHASTRGRVGKGMHVDFYWNHPLAPRAPGAGPEDDDEDSAKRTARDEENNGGFGKKITRGRDEEPPVGRTVRGRIDEPPSRYEDMSVRDIIATIEKKDKIIARQRESISLLTEAESPELAAVRAELRETRTKLDVRGPLKEKITQLEADNVALQADNEKLVALNKSLKAELRALQKE